MTPTPAQARFRLRLLTLTRWLPVGLMVGVYTLLALQRGLTVAETLTYATAQGVAVVLLELPTSGLADSLGRRPLLLAAGAINLGVGLLYLTAHSFWQFAAAAFGMGVYRALDSGPLEAWFVDAVHATEPDADVTPDLSAQSALLGLAIAGGSLASGALIAWHPVRGHSALVLPLVVSIALGVVHLAATALLVREPPRRTDGDSAWSGVRRAPAVVRGGVRLLATNRVLACVVAVELFWVVGSANQEQFLPIRLAELVLSPERAGAWLGPATAAGWVVFSAGAWLAGRLAPRLGHARTAVIARLTHGLAGATMGLTGGPWALIAAYLATNTLHGLANPPHAALLHREATSANRATVLSLNSLAVSLGSIAAMPLLGLLAHRAGAPAAMMTAGLVSMLGAALYVPAVRRGAGLSDGTSDADAPGAR